MNTEATSRLLDRVHKLLAKAEDESVTPPEAQALTAKAAELMAKYGIDRALLAAERPETDRPTSRMLDIDNPWARVKAHLLCGLASALRCQCILLAANRPGARIHIFGYTSDIERTDLLYASVLIQMWHGLAGAEVPAWCRSPRAWRRSWLLGFATAVISRVRAAEHAAASQATGPAAAQRVAHRAGAGRPGSGDPGRGGAGLPAHAHRARHLQRVRLPRWLRAGPAGRHRFRPVDPRAHARAHRRRPLASVGPPTAACAGTVASLLAECRS